MEQSKLYRLAEDIAKETGWCGKEICEVFLEALTDANFHQLRKELEKTISNHFGNE
jgi:hypothetical protein